jgi:hypothetical protein
MHGSLWAQIFETKLKKEALNKFMILSNLVCTQMWVFFSCVAFLNKISFT